MENLKDYFDIVRQTHYSPDGKKSQKNFAIFWKGTEEMVARRYFQKPGRAKKWIEKHGEDLLRKRLEDIVLGVRDAEGNLQREEVQRPANSKTGLFMVGGALQQPLRKLLYSYRSMRSRSYWDR